MTTSNTRRSVSRRTALAGLGVGALGLALATHRLDAFAQDASPAATAFPMAGHPLIGSWRWHVGPDAAPDEVFYSIHNAAGGFVDTDDAGYIYIGIWRATGERTGELVMNPGRPVPLDAVWEPTYVITDECKRPGAPIFLRLMLEVNETGDRLTATGLWDNPDGSRGTNEADRFNGQADRMTVAADTLGTPTS